MSFLYEYMSAEELEVAQENARIENELLHINNEYEVLTMEHAVKLNDIELQAILENASDEDLNHMYESEMVVYQEGVAEWWEKFKAWVKGIVNAILGKVNKTSENVSGEDKNKELELNVNPNALQKILNTIKNVLRNIVKFKDENGKVQVGKIAAEAGIGIAAAGGIAALFKPVREKYKTTVGKWIEWAKSLGKSSKEVGDALDSANVDSNGENGGIIKSLVTSAQNAVNSAVDTIKGGIKSLLGKPDYWEEDDDGSDNETETKDKKTPSNNEQKTEPDKVKEAKKAAQNGVTLKRIGNVEWRIDKSNGNIVKVEDGKETDVPRDKAPSGVRQLSQRYAAASNVEKQKETTGHAPSPVTDPNTKCTFTIKPDGKIVCKTSDGKSKFIGIDELPTYMKVKNMRTQFKKTYNDYINSNKTESSVDLNLDEINELFTESPFYMTTTEEGITLYEFAIDGFESDDTVEDSLFTEMDLDDIVAKYTYVDESVGSNSDYEELMGLLDEF